MNFEINTYAPDGTKLGTKPIMRAPYKHVAMRVFLKVAERAVEGVDGMSLDVDRANNTITVYDGDSVFNIMKLERCKA